MRMQKPPVLIAVSMVALTLCSYAFVGALGASLSRTDEPGGTPDDIAMASQKPDEYAWQLFFFLNRQAKLGVAGMADTSKSSFREYDDDAPVVWETWGLSSGLDVDTSTRPAKIIVNKSEVFKLPASIPVPWDQLDRTTPTPLILSPNLKTLAVAMSIAARPSMEMGNFEIQIAPIGTNPAQDESRMNRSTYETVRNEHLYSIEGLQAAAIKAKQSGKQSLVTFDSKSKEVKARWVHLSDCDSNPSCADRKRYHWRSTTIGGAKQIWGLASLHIITKDLPNWFWADFDHVDCEQKVGACADASEGAKTPTSDSTVPKGGTRPETKGTKWANYILRGTETDFNTTTGIKRILSNPVIENGFQPSSCMTCHSYASAALMGTVPDSGTSIPRITGRAGVANIGSRSDDIDTPDCWRFYTPRGAATGNCPSDFDKAVPLYFQTDFLWSIPFRAFSEKP